MSEFGPEAMAVDWLREEFRIDDTLGHLRARRRGRLVTVESGPPGHAVPHFRFRRDTVHLWFLELPKHTGGWEQTPFRDDIEALLGLLKEKFPWTVAAR